jgi:signal transduction histidine kinase
MSTLQLILADLTQKDINEMLLLSLGLLAVALHVEYTFGKNAGWIKRLIFYSFSLHALASVLCTKLYITCKNIRAKETIFLIHICLSYCSMIACVVVGLSMYKYMEKMRGALKKFMDKVKEAKKQAAEEKKQKAS